MTIMKHQWTAEEFERLEVHGWMRGHTDTETLFFVDSYHECQLVRDDYDGRIFYEERDSEGSWKHQLETFEELVEFLAY